MNKNFRYRVIGLLETVLVLTFSLTPINGQVVTEGSVPVPELETFVKTDELAVPWREIGCMAEHKTLDSGCSMATGQEYDRANRLTLFNPDGTLWYRFSVTFSEPDHFSKQDNRSFIPFSTIGLNKRTSTGPVLRLVGISTNWYEVEINENSQMTKFIYKKDPSWSKVTWEYWWRSDPRTYIDDGNQLFDKPDGSVIEGRGVKYFLFQATSGDWAKVQGFQANTSFYAWLRWRKGRNILVGCIFNSFKVPEVSK